MLILMGVFKGIARNKLKDFLKSENVIVNVKGQSLNAKESKLVINELSKTATMMAHHSQNINNLDILLSNNKDTIYVSIGQDSDYKDEIWVFFKNYESLKNNNIGKIKSKKLSNLIERCL